MLKLHLYMLILCSFMIFQCSYFYLKPAFLHDFHNPEDNRAYGTYIWYEFPEFITHNYTIENWIAGFCLLAIIGFIMYIGNKAFQWFMDEQFIRKSYILRFIWLEGEIEL